MTQDWSALLRLTPDDHGPWVVIVGSGLLLGLASMMALSTLPLKWILALLAGLIGLCGLIVVGETRKILLAAILLDNPLQMDVSWGYDFIAGGRGAIAGFNVSVTTIALLILYAAWFGERALTGRSPWKPTLGGNLAPALYLLFAGLSIFVAYDKTIAFYECWLFLQMFLLYVYLVRSVNTRQEVLFILSFLFVAVGIEALLMMAVFITGRNFEFYLISTLADASFMAEGNVRPGGTIGSPNSAAGYLSVLLVSAFSLMLVHRPQFIKWLAVGAFGLGLVALLLTQSRGGWLAFGLGVSLVGALAWARGWLSIRVSLICALIGLGGSLWFSETILERLFGDDGGSTSFRWKLLAIAYRVIADHPLLGVGASNFAVVLDQYALTEFIGKGDFRTIVHNKYLLVWAETGILGLSAFLCFLGATIRKGWQCWRLQDGFVSMAALGLTVGILVHMLHMFVDILNHRPNVQLIWTTAALIVCLHNIGRREYLARLQSMPTAPTQRNAVFR